MSGKVKHMERSHRSHKERQQIIGSIDISTKGRQEGAWYAKKHQQLRLKEIIKAMFRNRKTAK